MWWFLAKSYRGPNGWATRDACFDSSAAPPPCFLGCAGRSAPAVDVRSYAYCIVCPQGAFADTVRMLYAKRFGTGEPEIEVFGKPTLSTFEYARGLLERRREELGGTRGGAGLERIYMVGGEVMFLAGGGSDKRLLIEPQGEHG